MEHLHSPQVVALLGELLQDERDAHKGIPATDVLRPLTNSRYAAETLSGIGIDGVSMEKIEEWRDWTPTIEQWKLWFAQVTAGTRTYRFKGDPREYNLQGPVSSEAAPTKETK